MKNMYNYYNKYFCFIKGNFFSLMFNALKIILPVLCFYFSSSCKSDQLNTNQVEEPEFYHIDIETIVKNETSLKLSEIADTLEYIVLKTPPDIVITSIRRIIRTDKFMFIISKGTVYQFSNSGEFIKQIGLNGKGPGEYIVAMDIALDMTRDIIYVQAYPKLLLYNTDGTFIKSHDFNANNFALHENTLWGSFIHTGDRKYQCVALNENLDTVSSIPNDEYYKFSGLMVQS